MPREILPRDLFRDLENGRSLVLLDVRQPWENQLARLVGSLHIPLNELPARAKEVLSRPEPVVVYCHHGVRSLSAAAFLERLGAENVVSLAGGIDAWSCEIDPAIPRY